MFQAFLLEKGETFSTAIRAVDEAALPPGQVRGHVLVRIRG